MIAISRPSDHLDNAAQYQVAAGWPRRCGCPARISGGIHFALECGKDRRLGIMPISSNRTMKRF